MAAALVLVSAVACGKEEWNRNQLGVSNPYSETDETEPASEADDATDSATSAPANGSADAPVDARPTDARADARDATPG